MISQTLEKINRKWYDLKENQSVWGYTIQRGSKFIMIGYSQYFIENLQELNKIVFTDELLELLSLTRGINQPQKNFQTLKETQLWFTPELEIISPKIEILNEFNLDQNDVFVRIYSHRYLLCNKIEKYRISKVFSVVGDDVIIYANSLEEYLEKEFLTPSKIP